MRQACRFKNVEATRDGGIVHFVSGRRTFSETTRILIGADGANSRVRQLLPEAPATPRYFAIQEWFEITYKCRWA